MKLFISSSCSKQDNIFDALEELALVGFNNIELSGGNLFDNYTKEGLLDLRKRFNLNLLVHNYFPPQPEPFVLNIASAIPETVRHSQYLIDESIELSLELGQTHYGLHAGYIHEMSTVCDEYGVFLSGERIVDAAHIQQNFIDQVVKKMPKGFYLAIENAFPRGDGTPFSLMSSPEQILAHLEYYKNSPVGLLLDLGHLGVSSHILKFDKYFFLDILFTMWKSRIFELHISTHHGSKDTHQINRKDSPDIAFLRKYRNELFHIPLVLEWQNIDCTVAYMAYQELLPLLS